MKKRSSTSTVFPSGWSQRSYVKASNAEASDLFGSTVAISGDTAVVGAPQESSNQTSITNGTTSSSDNSVSAAGAVYVYKRTGNTWAQEAYLKPSNAQAGDQFGYSVAISGDTIVVGAIDEDSNQTSITNGTTSSSDNSASNSGAVYVFKRTGSTWVQEAYLKAANAEADDLFGSSVAISLETIVVGASGEDSNQSTVTNGATSSSDNSALSSGAAYVFKRSGSTWSQEAYLKAPNVEASDNFGVSVSISGDSLVIGAHQESSNQTTITNGTSASSDNSAASSGAAYVFRRSGTWWTQEAYLKAPNAQANDLFGYRVAISMETIVVGAYQEDSNQTTITNGTSASSDNSASNSGAAYVFKRTGTNWAQEAYLKPANAGADDNFGISVSINGDLIVVGASGEDSNQTTITNDATASNDNSASNSGAAYVFDKIGVWTQGGYLKAPNAEASDGFGGNVAVRGDTIIVGATSEDSGQISITNGTTASADNSATSAGAAYIIRHPPPNFHAPTIAAHNGTGTAPTIGSTSINLPENNNSIRGTSASGTDFFYEIDVTTGAIDGGFIGVCSNAFFAAGGLYGTTTAGGAFWYIGQNFAYGSASGTTAVSWGTYNQAAAGKTVGVVVSSGTKSVRIFKNGVFVGSFTLAAGATSPYYPFVGAWTGTGGIVGSFRTSASSYVGAYGYTAPTETVIPPPSFYASTIAAHNGVGTAPTIGSTSVSVVEGGNSIRGTAPASGDYFYEIDVTTGAGSSGFIGVATSAFFTAGGAYNTTTAAGAFWYVGNNTPYGNNSGTTADSWGTYNQAAAGTTIGVVVSTDSKKVRIYRNAVVVGTLSLPAGATAPFYPYVGGWSAGGIVGTLRTTQSSYAGAYVAP